MTRRVPLILLDETEKKAFAELVASGDELAVALFKKYEKLVEKTVSSLSQKDFDELGFLIDNQIRILIALPPVR